MDPQEKEKKGDRMRTVYERFRHNDRAMSSILDALFFLMLISIATVILFPSIMADRQYDAAEYTAVRDLDTHLLSSLLSSEAGSFDYQIDPLAIANLSIPNSSLTADPVDTMFGKQQHHRTYADLITEDILLGLGVVENGTYKSLNPVAQQHGPQTKQALRQYLDQKLGGRYEYNLEARWQPVKGFPVESQIIVGNMPPDDAIRQSAMLTLPLQKQVDKEEITQKLNDSYLEQTASYTNSTKAALYKEAFNSSITVASTSSATLITEMIFPADYLSSLLTADQNGGYMSYVTSPDNMGPTTEKKQDMLIAAYILNHSASTLLGQPRPIDPENMNNTIINTIETELIELNRDNIANVLKGQLNAQINSTVEDMVKSTDLNRTKGLRDEQMENIYNMVEPGNIEVVLSIW